VYDSLIYAVLYYFFALSSFPIPVGYNLLKPMDLHESIQFGRFVLSLKSVPIILLHGQRCIKL
jgi:hypothetical protein